MPKPKTARKPTAKDVDDFTEAFADKLSEEMVVKQFKEVLATFHPVSRAELLLFIRAAGAVGNMLVQLSQAYDTLLDGKAPTFTIEPHKGAMEIAAIDYSKVVMKTRGKMPKKRVKKK